MRRRIELVQVAYLCVRALIALRPSPGDVLALVRYAAPSLRRRDPREDGWCW